jgi:hypothetical protein
MAGVSDLPRLALSATLGASNEDRRKIGRHS